jgi:hypothetical protein
MTDDSDGIGRFLGYSASSSLDRRVMLGGDLEELSGGDFDVEGSCFLN